MTNDRIEFFIWPCTTPMRTMRSSIVPTVGSSIAVGGELFHVRSVAFTTGNDHLLRECFSTLVHLEPVSVTKVKS